MAFLSDDKRTVSPSGTNDGNVSKWNIPAIQTSTGSIAQTAGFAPHMFPHSPRVSLDGMKLKT
jgi:hypothetical protein